LKNLNDDILKLYSFENLWHSEKIDKNVEYFDLKKQIDLLTLVRKVKVTDLVDQDASIEQPL
jgi:hypothetical protein